MARRWWTPPRNEASPPPSPFTRSRAREAGQSSTSRQEIKMEVAPTYVTTHYPSTIHEVFSDLSEAKIALLQEIGLGGLIHVPDYKIDRNFSLWLLTRIRADPLELQFGNGSWVPITENDVERIMGVRSVGTEITQTIGEVPYSLIQKVKTILAADVLTLYSVKDVLQWELKKPIDPSDKDAYQVAAVLFSFAYLLESNRRTPEVPKGLLRTVATPSNLLNCNWARYVLRTIKKAAQKVQDDIEKGTATVVLGGCLLFVQLFYLEKIDFGKANIPSVREPVLANYWTGKIRELIDLDRGKGRPLLPSWFGRIKVLKKADNKPTTLKGKGKGKEVTRDGDEGTSSDDDVVAAVKLIEQHSNKTKEYLVGVIETELQKNKEELTSAVVARLRKRKGVMAAEGVRIGGGLTQKGTSGSSSMAIAEHQLEHMEAPHKNDDVTGKAYSGVANIGIGTSREISSPAIADQAEHPIAMNTKGTIDGEPSVYELNQGPRVRFSTKTVAKRPRVDCRAAMDTDFTESQPSSAEPDGAASGEEGSSEGIKIIICEPWLVEYLKATRNNP